MNHNTTVRVGAVTGALALTGVATYVGYLNGRRLLARQAAIARTIIGKLDEDAPYADKTYRKKRYRKAKRIDLLVLGDSIAAGLGADVPGDTLGARLSKGLAKQTKRPVRLTTLAVVGSESRDLAAQVDAIPPGYRPDLAVVVIGGNDVTHRIPVPESVDNLAKCILAVQHLGAEVVVGLCPDLGALRPVPQPLRALGSRESRRLAAAQREMALRVGARAVSLAHVVGPFFITNPEEMFSLDRFHPSSMGYRRTAKAMLPSLLAALGGHDEELPFGHHAPIG